MSGFGAKSFGLLQKYGLFEHLFPLSAAAFELPPYAYAREMLERGLANTDARVARRQAGDARPSCSRSCCGARCCASSTSGQAGPAPDLAQLMQACDAVLKAQQSRVAIPRRFAVPMRELLMLQPRFNRRSGVKSLSMLQHPRFRAAYDFLLLRARGRRRRSGARGLVDADSDCCRRRSASRWCRRAPRSVDGGPAAPRAGAPAPAPAAGRGVAQLAMRCALAPGLRRDRQQPRSSARAGAGGVRAHRPLSRDASRGALAALLDPPHGPAGSAGFRQRGRRPA